MPRYQVEVDVPSDRVARVVVPWVLTSDKGQITKEAGRSAEQIGIDAWISMGGTSPEDWRSEVAQWKALGVSYITLNTAFSRNHHQPISGNSLDDHLSAISKYHEAVSDLL